MNQVQSTWQVDRDVDQATLLKQLIDEAEVVVVGIGAGMSAATGFTYVGDRFTTAFSDFIEKYNYYDMLQAFLSEFEDWEEYWAFQSRFALLNYFDQPVGQAYLDLKEILKDKTYHVITTNADNAFYAAEYDMDKVFRIQGEYGLWHCSKFCHQQTYKDEQLIRQMASTQENMRVSSDLIPYCPKCGAPLEVNKRDAERGMIEVADWLAQCGRYHDFIDNHLDDKVLYLEIGVGVTTPQFIRRPFQEWTAQNNQALYVTMNQKPYRIARDVKDQAVRITDDILTVLSQVRTMKEG